MSAANSAGTSLNQPGLLMLEKLHIYHEELCIERGGGDCLVDTAVCECRFDFVFLQSRDEQFNRLSASSRKTEWCLSIRNRPKLRLVDLSMLFRFDSVLIFF